MVHKKEEYVWAFLRIGLGWIFLWAFVDKLFGLGFATAADKSWLLGNSPTAGFLQFATKGPFASLFQGLAGSAFVDWLFMLGLLLLGLSLILGIGVRAASYAGALLMLLMWLAALPPEHNPVLDEHIIYAITLLGIGTVRAGRWMGLGNWWSKTKLVKKYHWMG
jgi:thiosulfate dehydrogenase (quinone) large subunit